MVKFIWSNIAKQEYWNNIDYLLENWSEKEASRFINLVDENLHIIKQNPKTFAKTDYKNTRSVIITPQIRLFYKILNKNTVELLHFWNNYQNPEKINL